MESSVSHIFATSFLFIVTSFLKIFIPTSNDNFFVLLNYGFNHTQLISLESMVLDKSKSNDIVLCFSVTFGYMHMYGIMFI